MNYRAAVGQSIWGLADQLQKNKYLHSGHLKKDISVIYIGMRIHILLQILSLFPVEGGKRKQTNKQVFMSKATCYFKGRNYIAWFTTEIPVSFGTMETTGITGFNT